MQITNHRCESAAVDRHHPAVQPALVTRANGEASNGDSDNDNDNE